MKEFWISYLILIVFMSIKSKHIVKKYLLLLLVETVLSFLL